MSYNEKLLFKRIKQKQIKVNLKQNVNTRTIINRFNIETPSFTYKNSLSMFIFHFSTVPNLNYINYKNKIILYGETGISYFNNKYIRVYFLNESINSLSNHMKLHRIKKK